MGVLSAGRSADGIFTSGRTESAYSVPDRRSDDYEEISWQGRALENFSETGSGRSLFSASNIWHRAKKSRKQRIPGGRRTLATSGGDWLAMLLGPSSFQYSVTTDEQYVDCQNGSIRFRSDRGYRFVL